MSYYNHLSQAQLTQPTTHTKQNNTNTMIPPSRQLSAASISKVSAIVMYFQISHDLRSTVMYFFMWNWLIVHFIDCSSVGHWPARSQQKGKYFLWILVLSLWPLHQNNNVHWTLLSADIFLLLPFRSSSCFGMILNERGDATSPFIILGTCVQKHSTKIRYVQCT